MNDSSTRLVAVSALCISLGVAAGAFGAHALKDLKPMSDLQIWDKAVLYHLFNSLGALVVLCLTHLSLTVKERQRVAVLLLLSVGIFSGSLYLLVLLNQRWLGAITPIGGSGFIIAWIYVGYCSWKKATQSLMN